MRKNDEFEQRARELLRSKAEVAEIAERYADLYDFAPVGLFMLNGEHRVVEANLTGLEILGRPRAEVVGADFGSWLRPGPADALGGVCRLALDGRRSSACNVDLIRGDGRRLQARVEIAPVIGRTDRVRLALLDLGAGESADAELRHHRELLAGIADTIPVMIAVYDPNRHRFEVNREFRRVLGWTEDDLDSGDPMAMCYPDPDYREMVRCYMESLQAGWRDFRVRAKDGSFVDSAWANIRLSDETHVGIGIDMRGRRAVDVELRESRERLRLATEAAGLGVYEWHIPSDRAVWENPRMYEIFDRTPEEGPLTMSGFLQGVIHPEDTPGFEQRMAVAAESEAPWRTTCRIRTRTGDTRWLEALGRFVMSGGKAERLVGVVADATERVRTEQELQAHQLQLEERVRDRTRQLQSAVEALQAEAAERLTIEDRLRQLSRKSIDALEAERRSVSRELHDSIGGSLAALKLMLEDTAAQARESGTGAAERIERAIAYLANTIHETKRISVSLRPLTLDDLGLIATVKSHLRQFGEQFRGLRVGAEITVREDEVPDSRKIVLYRLLQESLVNVAKHSSANEVRFRLARHPDGGIVFEVCDNGRGFDPQQPSPTRGDMGGYGLRSMRERVEICNGSFSVDSQPGQSTCVRAVFPPETGHRSGSV
jgi:PAS domain S-box-containing protein